MKKINPLKIRSTLYMPAIQKDLAEIITKREKTNADAIVFCFEDALNENDIPKGIENLNKTFKELEYDPTLGTIVGENIPYRFIRVRNVDNLKELFTKLSALVLSNIDGFVIPKFTPYNIKEWENALADLPFYVMPTLETEDYYNPNITREMFNRLAISPLKDKVLMVRFGGNDLLRGLAMKRPKSVQYEITIYDTPLLNVINEVIMQARSKGFEVSAPVFEYFSEVYLESMEKELALDVAHGFVGKTAIHPKQCEYINDAFTLNKEDMEIAMGIVKAVEENGLKGGVYKQGDGMIEPTTHYAWAKRLVGH